MKVIAKEILGIDTISQGNDKPWQKLLQYMDEHKTEVPINFDFVGISVISPCTSPSFIKLLSNPNFCMTIYNKEELANSIRLLCTLNCFNPDRVTNIEYAKPKKVDSNESRINALANELIGYFYSEVGSNEITVPLFKRFDQIGHPDTLKYIETAIRRFADATKCEQVRIHTGKMYIQPHMIDAIVAMCDRLYKDGIDVYFDSDIKQVQNNLDMGFALSKANYSLPEKFKIMKGKLHKNRVGILTKYKDGKAKDEFGRQGRGEIVSTRLAIFKGFTKQKGAIKAIFCVFSTDELYTSTHWALEHDGEELEFPKHDMVYINIADLGIYNDFVGTKYHFSTAIQYAPGGEVVMFFLDESGKVSSKSLTIPERAKAVFDDFEIEYDKESLDAYITETRKILNKDGNN